MQIGQKKTSKSATLVFYLAILVALAVLSGGIGVHMGLWPPLQGFMQTIVTIKYGASAVAVLSLLVVIMLLSTRKKRGLPRALFAFMVGLVLCAPLGYLIATKGGGVPRIHDISTDTDNPPVFVELVGKRGVDANSLDYEGAVVADQQKTAYPDITSIYSSLPADQALNKAVKVAAELGWAVTGLSQSEGRFEATDQTLWFAFKDDVVLTVREVGNGRTKIDLRSVSRVGQSDLGTNAKRIRDFRTAYLMGE